MNLADCHSSGCEELRQNVIAIRRHDELRNGRTHTLRAVAGKHISEVAGGNRKCDWSTSTATKAHSAGDVVHHLRHNSGPVD